MSQTYGIFPYILRPERNFFFVKIENMRKVQVCCCFEDFEQRGVFPGTQFQNQHMDAARTGKMESALSLFVLGRAPRVPTTPDCAQGPWLVTPGGRPGRERGHVVCAVGCLIAAGLVKLFFRELLVHLAFKYLLCFSFFLFFFLRAQREANFPQC